MAGKLSPSSDALFNFLPKTIRRQLLMDRDPHGNVQVARIETETLLIQLVQTLLQTRQHAKEKEAKEGSAASPVPFRAQAHFFGYEGRAALPSLFDSQYCYSLGHTAAVLVQSGATGVMAAINNLTGPVAHWACGGAPVTAMLNVERRHGKNKPVIKKALVELDGRPFRLLQAVRPTWLTKDCYLSPGPIQFDGAGSKDTTFTLRLEQMGSDAEADAMQGVMCTASGALTEARIAHKLSLPDQLSSLNSIAFTATSAASSKTRAHLTRPFLRKVCIPCPIPLCIPCLSV
jgi:pyrophosphate--fructose-6-phosphate 1-phosphotransferase